MKPEELKLVVREKYGQIARQGFDNPIIHKQKAIEIPESILHAFLTTEESADFRSGEKGIFSLTLSGQKPKQDLVP